ncbi:hypothetical protein C8Q73DRAFT_203951 [Cubamyces lactineus]|nr:hypothetical protein C8Q73DRAFT_203951 [Cubamyces lactineus]
MASLFSPYLLPALKLDDETRDRVCAQYDWRCPFCPGANILGPYASPFYYIVPPTLKGLSQRIWLTEAGLIPNDNDYSADEDDNLIILCEEHRRRFAHGSFFLCPSLGDLEVLLEWEERWARESHAETIGSHLKTRSTRIVPPEALSGNFSLLYTTGFSDNMLAFRDARMLLATHTVTPCQIAYGLPRLRERDISPVLNVSVNSEATEPPYLDLLFRLNTPDRPGRINPYKVLVRALELVGCSFIPADVFKYEFDEKSQMMKGYPVAGSNPIERYRAILLKLKDLYSIPFPFDDGGDACGSEEEGLVSTLLMYQ